MTDRSCLDQLAGVAFRQGYIPIQDGGVVRVRIEGERAVLTLKGATSGISRREYEYEIPRQDAESILATLCQRPHIEKTRYTLPWADKVWTIDVFSGENEGLVLAEVELSSQEEVVEKTSLGRRRSIGRSTLLQRQPRAQSLLQVAGRLDYPVSSIPQKAYSDPTPVPNASERRSRRGPHQRQRPRARSPRYNRQWPQSQWQDWRRG